MILKLLSISQESQQLPVPKMGGAELNGAKKAIRKLPFEVVRLFTKIQFLDDGTVALNVLALEVIKQGAALSNQCNQCTLCAEIFFVGFKMLGQVTDPV